MINKTNGWTTFECLGNGQADVPGFVNYWGSDPFHSLKLLRHTIIEADKYFRLLSVSSLKFLLFLLYSLPPWQQGPDLPLREIESLVILRLLIIAVVNTGQRNGRVLINLLPKRLTKWGSISKWPDPVYTVFFRKTKYHIISVQETSYHQHLSIKPLAEYELLPSTFLPKVKVYWVAHSIWLLKWLTISPKVILLINQ